MTKGLDKVLSNLNKEIRKIKGDVFIGVRKAGLHIQGESMELTPVDFGVLRNSAFTDAERQGEKSVARVGYTAKYAAAVHEFPMTLRGQPRAHFGRTRTTALFGAVIPGRQFGGGSGRGVYWEGGENKFLEKAIARNHKFILDVVQKSAKIK